ncbi:uncharacterized protein PRCAT00002538001 [Priceomyces carsonii]|uniref:uncharacterized protein n=1 Tax=Priceomyces carsonii TaxID=28549 RepID=UPI002ED7DFAD|nr:unnamed protein product [Priceomyces carsonii]
MFTKADIKIQVDDSAVFRPHDIIKGSVLVNAKKDFNIRSLTINFSVDLYTTFIEVIVEKIWIDGQIRTRTRRVRHTEKHNLLACQLELGSSLQIEKLSKDQHQEYRFEFTFPEIVSCSTCGRQTILPPSLEHMEQNSFILQSTYQLEATLVPDSRIGGNSQARKSLKFLPNGYGNANPGPDVIHVDGIVWKEKVKKFVDEHYDELYNSDPEAVREKVDTSKAIPNPLQKSHSKTRSIRKFFDNKYKKETHGKLVSDVKLEVSAISPSSIRLQEDITERLRFLIRTKIEDLRPDFILYCNESSQLGSFAITGFAMSVVTKYFVLANGFKGELSSSRLVSRKKLGYGLAFDIVDFLPNLDDPSIREWEIPAGKLFDEEHVKLISFLSSPDYVSACGSLNISHLLDFELLIASDLEATPKRFKFSLPSHLI